MSMIAFPPARGVACGRDSSACACARAHGARSGRARTQAGYGRIDGGGDRRGRFGGLRVGRPFAAKYLRQAPDRPGFALYGLHALCALGCRRPGTRGVSSRTECLSVSAPLRTHRDCCANARMHWARRDRIAILVTKTFRARCAKRTVFTASIDGEGNEHGREP